MSKHNEGKWAAAEWGDAIKVESIQRTPGLPIVDVVAICSGPNKKANARLIAAAPELLAMLERTRDELEASGGFDGDESLFSDIVGLIAKATGAAE